jgi:gelsolin
MASGLRKQKKYNWKETNLSLFGSDLEKKIKEASAHGEKAWEGAGTKVGVQIWRIVQFKVTHWPKGDYGRFYDGDSYIVLNTYKRDPSSEALSWDVHFWIGKYSTQDEYGTAAYKTVELDHFLKDAAVQHREVQGNESRLFRSYFDRIVIWKGGADSGFNHVEPEKYTARLLHIKGRKENIRIDEVKLRRKYINSGDVFILDLGLKIIQWNGRESNKDERSAAASFMMALKSDRGGRPEVETVEEEGLSESHEFYRNIPAGMFRSKKPRSAEAGGADEDVKSEEKVLHRIHEKKDNQLSFKQVASGIISRGYLDPTDVFVLDTGFHVFVWVGKDATSHEKGGGLVIAHEYVKNSKHPFLPLTRVAQGQLLESFESAFDDKVAIGSNIQGKGDCVIL